MTARCGYRFAGVAALAAGWILAFAVPASHADQYARHNNEGNRLAQEGRLDEALNRYQTARVERPGAPEVDYNIGNVLHQKEVYDTALMAYQDALGRLRGSLVPNTYYNMGNTLFRQGEYESAVEAYKRALIENPVDQDAKFNLELALKQMTADSSQQQQQEKQDQENPPDSSDQQNQDQNQEQKADSTQQQQQPQEEQDSQQEQDPTEQQQEQAEQQQAQAPPQGMTREDAERLLDALKQDELDLQKKRAQRLANPAPVARDW
jgi:Ca-activated chloride channel family protein